MLGAVCRPSRGPLDTISPFLMPAALHTKEALHSIKHLRADLLKIACDKPPALEPIATTFASHVDNATDDMAEPQVILCIVRQRIPLHF